MDANSYWSAVRDLRLRVAELLESLTADEWEHPSLCEGWRIRDVAGHLSIIPTIRSTELLAATPRARFDLNRVNSDLARRAAAQQPDQLVATIRRTADHRSTARLLDTRNALFDVIVHSQNIALPLGRDFSVDAEHVRAGLDRVWQMGWPFRAKRRLHGLSLVASDADWRTGRGPEVRGPALALLLLLTGRVHVALPWLEGPGAARLRMSTI